MITRDNITHLFIKLSKKYAAYETTSLTYQEGEKLLQSIHYNLMMTNSTTPLASEGDINLLYQSCLSLRKNQIESVQSNFKKLLSCYKSFNNICLKDTIEKGLPGFFKYYDVEFDALNNIITFDYPTLINLSEYQGIELADQYITYLTWENSLLQSIGSNIVLSILNNYHDENENLVINIPQIILPNLFAKFLLGNQAIYTRINDSAINHLVELFFNWSQSQFLEAFQSFIDQFDLSSDAKLYFIEYSKLLHKEIHLYIEMDLLRKIFI